MTLYQKIREKIYDSIRFGAEKMSLSSVGLMRNGLLRCFAEKGREGCRGDIGLKREHWTEEGILDRRGNRWL